METFLIDTTGMPSGIWWAEAGDAAEQPTIPRMVSTQKIISLKHVYSAEVEKSWDSTKSTGRKPVTSCILLGKSPTFSEPVFSLIKMRIINIVRDKAPGTEQLFGRCQFPSL